MNLLLTSSAARTAAVDSSLVGERRHCTSAPLARKASPLQLAIFKQQTFIIVRSQPEICQHPPVTGISANGHAPPLNSLAPPAARFYRASIWTCINY